MKGSTRLMKEFCVLRRLIVIFGCFVTASLGVANQDVLVVSGLPGDAVYSSEIDASAKHWREAAEKAGHRFVHITPDGMRDQLARFRTSLATLDTGSNELLWIVLLGHGSAQGRSPKFNLEGDDLAAEELVKVLASCKRPVVIAACFSTSGAFLKPLAGANRIVIAATRSAGEENWCRFGLFFAQSINGLDADEDSDGQVSVWEAWRRGMQLVEAFYKERGRLCTEHALLDDVGDGRGSGPKQGAVAKEHSLSPSAIELSLSETQRAKRAELEAKLGRLRDRKSTMNPSDYTEELEALLLQIARVYPVGSSTK